MVSLLTIVLRSVAWRIVSLGFGAHLFETRVLDEFLGVAGHSLGDVDLPIIWRVLAHELVKGEKFLVRKPQGVVVLRGCLVESFFVHGGDAKAGREPLPHLHIIVRVGCAAAALCAFVARR